MEPNGRTETQIHNHRNRLANILRPDGMEGTSRMRGVHAQPGPNGGVRQCLPREAHLDSGKKEVSPMDPRLRPQLPHSETDKNHLHGLRE